MIEFFEIQSVCYILSCHLYHHLDMSRTNLEVKKWQWLPFLGCILEAVSCAQLPESWLNSGRWLCKMAVTLERKEAAKLHQPGAHLSFHLLSAGGSFLLVYSPLHAFQLPCLMEKSSMCEGGPGPHWTFSHRIGATATSGCAWHRDSHSTERPTQIHSLPDGQGASHLS